MDFMHRLQQSTGTCIGASTCTCRGAGISTGARAQGMDYCLTTDGLVKFRDMIYVSNNSELKKVILREFHAKPY